ncbi:hypothetical protein ABZ086_36140, partial [Streptomyces halstedii]
TTYGMVSAYEAIAMAQRMPFGEVARMALMGTAERVGAERAYAIGLVSEVTEPGGAVAAALRTAAVPPPAPEDPGTEQGPEATAVPQQRTPDQAPDAEPAPPATDTAPAAPQAPEAGPSTAYLALARLGLQDRRLTLSAHDCTALEAQAAQWLARGVSVDHLTSALTAGLPAEIGYPAGFVRRRLTDKMPPRLPAENTAPDTPAPARRVLMECTDCGRPGQPEALPDGLCRPCRETHSQGTAENPDHTTEGDEAADIKTHMTNLRDLLKTV